MTTPTLQPVSRIDPNPMIVSGLFTAILMNAAGVFARSLDSQPVKREARNLAGIRQYHAFLADAQGLQSAHQKLIQIAGADDRPVFPMGKETLWLSSDDMLRSYRAIRQRASELYVASTIRSIQMPYFQFTEGERKPLASALETMREMVEISIHPATFGICVNALADGLGASVSFLSSLLPPEQSGGSGKPGVG